jgi:8-hydroxy-5-deazaflavin:NADPH oxidoreductase
MIGSRDPAKLHAWHRTGGPQAHVGTLAETAQFGDLVVLSVVGTAAEDVIRLAGVENLAGKIVLDASDPLDFSSGRPGLFVGTTDSLASASSGSFPTRTSSRASTLFLPWSTRA